MADEEIKRISTGILGLDDICYGGIPAGNQVLIAGEAGTGKTLMCFEILYKNAKINVPSTFITLEESRRSLLENAKGAFSYFDDIEDLLSVGTIIVEEKEVINAFSSRENWQTFIAGINKTLHTNKSQLLVIDSITSLRPMAEDDRVFTRYVNFMIENFRNLGVTVFVTVEAGASQLREVSGLYGTHMFDGILKLREVDVSGSSQYLIKIVKMRRSDHRNASMPYEITPKGFSIFK
jgi:circadian clock protein KaiC